jgi:hypothetical protein
LAEKYKGCNSRSSIHEINASVRGYKGAHHGDRPDMGGRAGGAENGKWIADRIMFVFIATLD